MPGHRPDSPAKFSWVFENRPLGTRGAFFKIPIFTWASGAPSKLPRVIFDVLAWAGKNARVFFEYFFQKSLPGTPLPTLPLVKMHSLELLFFSLTLPGGRSLKKCQKSTRFLNILIFIGAQLCSFIVGRVGREIWISEFHLIYRGQAGLEIAPVIFS